MGIQWATAGKYFTFSEGKRKRSSFFGCDIILFIYFFFDEPKTISEFFV